MKLRNLLTRKTFIVIIVVILILAGIGISFYLSNKQKPTQENQQKITHSFCLADNEVAIFQFHGSRLRETSADVIVTDKITTRELFRFQIDNIVPHYHPYEFHKCGVYVIRQFNYDIKTRRATPGYRIELWKYNYSGTGNSVLLFSSTDENGLYKSNFNSDFRIDPLEIYAALISGYGGHPDFALVIRDIKVASNRFILLYEKLIAENPFLAGIYGLKEWTKKGDFFWADLFEAANVNAFIRIERETWKVDILPAPKDVLGGDALNVENGYITIQPDSPWIGIYEQEEIEKERRRKEGIGTELYIYNLFTKDQKFVASTTEPLWYFRPNWFSDTELQYELPTGEKKIYKISE
jgi:hypothetical protein